MNSRYIWEWDDWRPHWIYWTIENFWRTFKGNWDWSEFSLEFETSGVVNVFCNELTVLFWLESYIGASFNFTKRLLSIHITSQIVARNVASDMYGRGWKWKQFDYCLINDWNWALSCLIMGWWGGDWSKIASWVDFPAQSSWSYGLLTRVSTISFCRMRYDRFIVTWLRERALYINFDYRRSRCDEREIWEGGRRTEWHVRITTLAEKVCEVVR